MSDTRICDGCGENITGWSSYYEVTPFGIVSTAMSTTNTSTSATHRHYCTSCMVKIEKLFAGQGREWEPGDPIE